ncbi:MAG: hypothetical protein PHS86_10705, partial [Syntrophaceae bacterium]|nr:hypothetical protein [Syntrophaceae bacterium]
MSKKQYESNQDIYDNLIAFIEEQKKEAEVIADISSMGKWGEQLNQLTAWTKSEADSVCSIPQSTWELAGILNPSISSNQDEERASVEDIFHDLAGKVRESLTDGSKIESLLRNYENLHKWKADYAKEAELYAQEIDELDEVVIIKRRERSWQLLATIEQTENLSDKAKLIKEAEDWNPFDGEISKKIDVFRNELARGLTAEEIRQHLGYLQSTRRTNLSQFETSLKTLEPKKASQPDYFSAEDQAKIEEAREYFNDLRDRGGRRTSMVATKQLVDTYIAYREFQQERMEQVFYQDVLVSRAEAEAETLRVYRAASQERLQELIENAKVMSNSSPTAAIAYIERLLTDRIERIIGDKPELINLVPLTLEDNEKLVEFKEVIDRDLKPKEELAKKELELSTKADSLFTRVSHLLKSHSAFPILVVQDQIKQLAETASEERLNMVELQFERLEIDLERIKEMQLGLIPTALQKLRDQLHGFDTMLTQDWFGIPGYDALSKTEAYAGLNLPPKPQELNNYAPRGVKRAPIEKEILDVESAVYTIRQVTTVVEQKLNDTKPPDVVGAIQEFNTIRDRLDLAPYRAFKDLEQLVSQHQGLI